MKEAASQGAKRPLTRGDAWWRGWDLNPRPSGYEPDELPDCSTPRRTNEGSTRPGPRQPGRTDFEAVGSGVCWLAESSA